MNVLVTGGSSGLGLAMASALAAAGSTVALTSRSGERAREVAADLPRAIGVKHISAGDVVVVFFDFLFCGRHDASPLRLRSEGPAKGLIYKDISTVLGLCNGGSVAS